MILKPVAALAAFLLSASPLLAHAEAAPAPAAAAPANLAVAPQGAEHWVIASIAGKHGEASRWTGADGARVSRQSILLRGFSTEIEQHLWLGRDGLPVRLEVKGRTPAGDAAETFRAADGKFSFQSRADKGAGVLKGPAAYVPFGGSFDATAALAEALVKAPGHSLDLLPSGRAKLEKLATRTVNGKALDLWLLSGIDIAPQPLWFDGGRMFAIADTLSYLPTGWEKAGPELSRLQDEAIAARAPEQLARLAPKTGPLAFTNVRIFDSAGLKFVDDQTVTVGGGRILAVGPAATTPVPAGARRIDGRGKTLVPGLWDNHMHYGGDSTGALLMSQGVTSIRDPGNVPEESRLRRERIAAGTLLGPRIVASMLIDGPGPLAAQSAVVVKDRAEAEAAVRKAKEGGFTAVKLYGSLDPALVAPIAREAHRLGLRVHGHIPRTMRTLDAVRAGYDEITHINWVLMQAMPDSVLAESNSLARFYGPARYGASVDLKSPAMVAYLDELAQRGVDVDPTVAIFEDMYCNEPGTLGPILQPFEGVVPPAYERQGKSGGFIAPLPDLPRSAMCKSFGKMKELLVELNNRHVPLLAGTDGYGLELVRDLELYVEAGLTPAQSLATATSIPAQVFGFAGQIGDVKPGRRSELVLVDGDPSKRIGDLRRVEWVVLGERLLNGEALRTEAGLTGMPK